MPCLAADIHDIIDLIDEDTKELRKLLDGNDSLPGEKGTA
jgi:hypothetical protein